MRKSELTRLDGELRRFLSSLLDGQGRPERRTALEEYVVGLLLDGDRKSVGPMAARLADDPKQADAVRQRLQQCLAGSTWAEGEVWKRLAAKVDRELPNVEALVLDDTGFAKKGDKSVGVARQYSGTLGRTDNCQVATSLHLAGEAGSACIGFRLYLPEAWTNDRKRCRQAGVPDEAVFRKKWEIALDLLDEALRWKVRRHVVLADAGYGDIPEFRARLVEREMLYVVGVQGSHCVWPPGTRIRAPENAGKRGRPRMKWVVPEGARRVPITELAATLTYKRIVWREGSKGPQSSRFAAVRVRSAENHHHRHPPSDEQWLICEWPEGEKEPTKFWFSNLPATTKLRRLVQLAKLRWRVERDYQDLKQEIGLDHFEGRTWAGFHRHALLCSVAHAFLAIRRALFPPEHRALDATHGATGVAIHSAA
jgi:SRSO17 transposase